MLRPQRQAHPARPARRRWATDTAPCTAAACSCPAPADDWPQSWRRSPAQTWPSRARGRAAGRAPTPNFGRCLGASSGSVRAPALSTGHTSDLQTISRMEWTHPRVQFLHMSKSGPTRDKSGGGGAISCVAAEAGARHAGSRAHVVLEGKTFDPSPNLKRFFLSHKTRDSTGGQVLLGTPTVADEFELRSHIV